MTILVLEDGTGVPAANTYSSLEAAGTYHATRGTVEAWAELVAQFAAEGMLIEATRKIDQTYTWPGPILSWAQGRALPRAVIYLQDGRQLSPVEQVAVAADGAAWLALRLWNTRQLGGERTVQSESLPDYSVTYDADKGASFGELDSILAQIIDGGGLGGGFTGGKVVRWS